MLKIFLNEIISKKKYYLYILLFYVIIFGTALSFKSYLAEYFQNIYNLMLIIMFSGGVGTIPNYTKEQSMGIHSKLPLSLMQLYLIRFASISMFSIFYVIILFIVSIFDKDALSVSNTFGIIFFSFMIFMFIIHIDLKIYLEKYKWKKKILIYILPYIYLLAIIACFVILMENQKQMFDLIYAKFLLMIFIISICFSLSFKIFKLRKSYKV
jgi:hypothetical protein